MSPLRVIFSLLIVCLLITATAPASAESIDWRDHFCQLSDLAADNFLYDCGGYSDLVVKGFMAYAVSKTRGLQVVDVSDPLDPENLGRCQGEPLLRGNRGVPKSA